MLEIILGVSARDATASKNAGNYLSLFFGQPGPVIRHGDMKDEFSILMQQSRE